MMLSSISDRLNLLSILSDILNLLIYSSSALSYPFFMESNLLLLSIYSLNLGLPFLTELFLFYLTPSSLFCSSDAYKMKALFRPNIC